MIEINSGFLSSIGIVFDIIGAFFLAESFLLKKTDKIVKESSSYMDGNPFLLPSFITQRIEVKTGFGFLMLGFLLQMISNADFVNQGRDKIFWLILPVGLVLWLISVLIVRFWSKKLGQAALLKEDGVNFLKSLNEVKKEDQERYNKLALFYGEALDLKKSDDEDDQSYSERVMSFIVHKNPQQNNNNEYSSFLSLLWRKKYKYLISITCIILILLIVFIELVTGGKIHINWSDKIYYSILLLTAGVIFWYSRETADLKDISNKSIKELRKQTYFTQRPFIRLQWIEPTSANLSGIRIINEGYGIAVNLTINSNTKPVIIRSIVAGEKASKSYTDAGYEDANLKDDNEFIKHFLPTNDYEISVSYQDIVGNLYKQVFKTNDKLNDKFELFDWDIPEDFKSQKFKRIKKL